MKTPIITSITFFGFLTFGNAWSQDELEIDISAEEEEVIFIEEETAADADLVIEEGEISGDGEIFIDTDTADELVIEEGDAQGEEEISIDAGTTEELVIEEGGPQGEGEISIDMDEPGTMDDTGEELIVDAPEEEAAPTAAAKGGLEIALGRAQLEFAPLLKSGESVDSTNYGHISASATWDSGAAWEMRLAGRVDGYSQTGKPTWDEVTLDYDDSYLRYRGENLRFTAGAQTVIWGRIDEIPPTDRLSVQDLTRYILDDLQDRRRARPLLRMEGFWGDNKLDLVWYPTFRGAELPDKDSIWYPVDRSRGEIIGIESTPVMAAVVAGAAIDDDTPAGDGGGGLRYSRTESAFDFALTAQYGRQSVPYYRYDVASNTLEAEYPRAWSLGGDVGFEAADATWRFEVAWISDIPVTRDDMTYTKVKGVNWGAGVEFHPGDGDARVNLQLVGTNLYNTPDILDRTEIYNLNGSVEIPFAQERWRARMRFFVGLDKKDVYVNPEIAFLGWEPHEFYLELHHFDGEDGTLGGFHEDHSLLAVGWRAEF
jgi:hypothetical protein